MQKEKMTTSNANSLIEVKAALALGDLNRRERLLKTIRGEPEWKTYARFIAMWMICAVYIWYISPVNLTSLLLVLLLMLVFIVFASHDSLSRRMDALIELIGEDRLKKTKTDEEDADHCG